MLVSLAAEVVERLFMRVEEGVELLIGARQGVQARREQPSVSLLSSRAVPKAATRVNTVRKIQRTLILALYSSTCG